VRQVTVSALRNAGYRVLVAANGAEAIRVASENGALRLLVTDVVMPRSARAGASAHRQSVSLRFDSRRTSSYPAVRRRPRHHRVGFPDRTIGNSNTIRTAAWAGRLGSARFRSAWLARSP
jgi:hypothetical protein